MPRNKDLKRIVRARMKKTGEAYTAARAHILRKNPTKAARHDAPPAPAADPAAIAGMRDDTMAAKTGRTWREWVSALDEAGAAALPHRDIARLVAGTYGIGSWWAQMVTVGYERIKGLRERGQRRGGTYEVTKSRTFPVPVTVLFEAWAVEAARRAWLDEPGVVVRRATRPKAMRLGWPDGTIVAVWFLSKGPSKSVAAVAHTKLANRAAVDRAKLAWTARLNALASILPAARV